MNCTPLRRLAALAVAPVLAVGLSVAPAQADVLDEIELTGGWIAGQLTDGLSIDPIYGDFGPDFGLTADALVALATLDQQPAARQEILDALAENVDAYSAPSEGVVRAGAASKLGNAVRIAGGDPTSFGGVDLVDRVEQRVQESGRVTDLAPSDFSNIITQSLAARLLVAADSDLADEVVGYLVAQQCTDGSFPAGLSDAGCVTNAGEPANGGVDQTAAAVDALLDAQEAGLEVANLQAAIGGTVDYLVQEQAEDGSFENLSSFGEPVVANSNSTGTAAVALSRLGQELEAARATQWVRYNQADEFVEGTPLEDDLGAIAYSEEAFELGLDEGIVDETTDQWRRATYQAALALPHAAPDALFDVTAPEQVEAGTSFEVEVDGPAAGEELFALLLPSEVIAGLEDELAEETPEELLERPEVRASARAVVGGAARPEGRLGTRAVLDPTSTTLEVETDADLEADDYALLVLSEFDDRGGVTTLAVSAADGGDDGAGDGGAGGGAGDGSDDGLSGTGNGVVGGSDALPAAGAETQPWLPWAAGAFLLAGAALVVAGRGRYENV